MLTKRTKSFYVTGVLLLLCLSFIFYTACDNRNPSDAEISELVAFLSLDAKPEVIAADDGATKCTLTVTVIDEFSNAVEGATVRLRVANNIGSISPIGDSLTNNEGRYLAIFSDIGTAGTANIIATSSGTADSQTVQIKEVNNSLALGFTDDSTLFATRNDSLKIGATLIGTLGSALKDKEINFTTTKGTITAIDSTDASGQAVAYLYGSFGNTGTAVVTAEYSRPGFKEYAVDTINVSMLPIQDVDNIAMSIFGDDLQTGDGDDSLRVRASVTDSTGLPVVDGTRILFSVRDGSNPYQGEISPVDSGMTANGIAEAYLKNTTSTSDSIIVRAYHVTAEGEVFDEDTVSILPGEPALITLTADPDSLTVGSGHTAILQATVKDAYDNLVRSGYQIEFDNSLTSSSVVGLSNTVNGIATSLYTVGETAGVDTITASYVIDPENTITGTANTWCLSSSGNQISLLAQPPTVTVRGAGGVESSVISASVKDNNQNPAADSTRVVFKIIAAPQSDSINGRAYLDTLAKFEDTSYTANGEARTTLVSGDRPGTISIRAALESGVSTAQPLVTVQSGPPAHINVGLGATELTNAIYEWELSATVTDLYSNPVIQRTTVYFSARPETVLNVGGDSIYTGNQSKSGNSYPGVAFTTATYTCQALNDTVSIFARIETENGDSIYGVLDSVVIPLDPEKTRIYLSASEQNLVLQNTSDVDSSDITAQLLDDNNCPIANGIIDFAAENAGHIGPPQSDTTDDQGFAYAVFWIRGEEIISPVLPNEVTATVVARLRSYPEVEATLDIHCLRVN
ncbi:MAG: hypothetical protein GF307_04945 [candidate division Zixibacteria bacterium]|nr:hypothetical protein [candidate division Zixibacteria bacterium]